MLDDELDDELLEVPFSSELSEEASLPGKKLEEGFEHWRIEVDKGQTPVRVDKFLMDHMPGTSRNRIQKAAEAGTIRAGDKPVKSNYKVKPGDIISLVLDHPKRDWEIVPEDIPLDVVYEDDVLLVVNKPAGLVVHPGCGNYSGTLVNALAWHLRDDKGFDPTAPRPVRLDDVAPDTLFRLVSNPRILFRAVERRRTRWLCIDTATRRSYTVSGRAEVKVES